MKDQIKFGGNIVDTSKQKPDLMETSRASPDSAKRILAHLEHGARMPPSKPARTAKWKADGWTLGLGLLLLAMCSIAWLTYERTIRSSAFKAGYSTMRTSASHEGKRVNTRERSAPVDRTQAEAPAQALVKPVEQPAAIVNDAAPSQTQTVDQRQTMAAAAPDAVVATSSTLPARKDNTPVLVPAISTAAPAHIASVGAVHSRPATAGAHHKTNSTATARMPAATAVSTRGKTAPTNDTDVALLTALVAHANQPTVVTPERSRDIVERYDGDNTADLLARCRQLGLIEGMLCRSRICSGRWDTDAVCRVPAP